MKQCDIKFNLDEDGYLWVSYDGGCTYESLGKVRGDNGSDGDDGANGTNGNTPLLRIRENHWEVSYNGGSDWSTLSDIPVNGSDGQNGTDGQNGINGTQIQIDSTVGQDSDPTAAARVEVTNVGEGVVRLKFFNLKGLQGQTGADGTPGTAVNFNFKNNSGACEHINDAYIDSNNHLKVLVELPNTFVDCGQFKGDTGTQGPQGVQGPQGSQGIQGSLVYFTSTYDSGFNITGARVGDVLVYTGNAISGIALQGDVFKCTAIENSVQVWTSQNLNIKGQKGDRGDASDITGEDFESLVLRLRGYPLYSQGQGIDIVPNSEGYFTIETKIDGNTIKFDSDGRMYATATGGGGTATLDVHLKPSAEDCSAVGDAYIASNGHLMVIEVVAEPQTFVDYGQIRGNDGHAANWFIGTANPPTTVSDSINGDMYLNTQTYNVYQRVDSSNIETWVYKCNIKGANGATWSSGDSNPSGGNVDDFYLQTSTSGPQIIKKKTDASTWTTVATINNGTPGNMWYADSINVSPYYPTSGSYNEDDLFLNTYNGDVYRYSSSATPHWSLVGNIKGPQGQGLPGTSSYLHVMYASNNQGANMNAHPSANLPYIGVYADNSPSASGSAAAYTWIKYIGSDGEDGTVVSKAYRFLPYGHDSQIVLANRDAFSISDTMCIADARITIHEETENKYASVHLTIFTKLYDIFWAKVMDDSYVYGGDSGFIGFVDGWLLEENGIQGQDEYLLPEIDSEKPDKTSWYGSINIRHSNNWDGNVVQPIQDTNPAILIDLHGIMAYDADFDNLFADNMTFLLVFHC